MRYVIAVLVMFVVPFAIAGIYLLFLKLFSKRHYAESSEVYSPESKIRHATLLVSAPISLYIYLTKVAPAYTLSHDVAIFNQLEKVFGFLLTFIITETVILLVIIAPYVIIDKMEPAQRYAVILTVLVICITLLLII